ncbi:MAG: hypothetical protein IT435_17770 [Phycisphaerales bacterium]|nr:hypothetical protein [Phycisphaerales bacterium]
MIPPLPALDRPPPGVLPAETLRLKEPPDLETVEAAFALGAGPETLDELDPKLPTRDALGTAMLVRPALDDPELRSKDPVDREGELPLVREEAPALLREGALALLREGALALLREGALALLREGALAVLRDGAFTVGRDALLGRLGVAKLRLDPPELRALPRSPPPDRLPGSASAIGAPQIASITHNNVARLKVPPTRPPDSPAPPDTRPNIPISLIRQGQARTFPATPPAFSVRSWSRSIALHLFAGSVRQRPFDRIIVRTHQHPECCFGIHPPYGLRTSIHASPEPAACLHRWLPLPTNFRNYA